MIHDDVVPKPSLDRTREHPEPMLLVSGSGLQPWIWGRFISELPANTPVGIAERPSGTADAPLAEYVDHAIAAAPAERFAIVAHSLGAIVGLEAANAVPDRVTRFLAVAGVVPLPPGSFVSAMPIPNRWILSAAIRLVGTRPPEKVIRQSLTTRLEPAVADRIVDTFQPESRHLFTTKLNQTDQPQHRGYLITSSDTEIAPKLQQRFVKTLDPEWTDTIDTGHLPMLEDPQKFAVRVLDFINATTA